jgi:hypothetical protein
VYRYFTNEKFPTFLGIAFGLGFWGFTGGLLDIFEDPKFGTAMEIIALTIFVVWGVNSGDKSAREIVKVAVIKELETEDPEAAKKLKTRKLWK